MKARPRSSGSIFHLLALPRHPGPGSNSPAEVDGGRERGSEGVRERESERAREREMEKGGRRKKRKETRSIESSDTRPLISSGFWEEGGRGGELWRWCFVEVRCVCARVCVCAYVCVCVRVRVRKCKEMLPQGRQSHTIIREKKKTHSAFVLVPESLRKFPLFFSHLIIH